MIRRLTATEVKARLFALLDEVENGGEIEITRDGITVARLAPARNAHALKGRFAGIVSTNATDEDLFATRASWDLP